ncbi:membrane protein insertase YidC [Candidatus Igneacidithiobacillus taiwanensis]|uniref:membrane protein insertase YidC n=1 Tax=Candidatus Igneacidithiobacillus taiwanensis TaxID=1945924 RepID=UPI00289AD80D|nr:membrane protein insertase YidC [Candidatus Igneacidithiobacillus taiwanensis]MCE5359637.1 membrane protein insertase YidC [Acidithiobacillus sp.]
MDTQRTILAVVLSVIVLLLFEWLAPHPKPAPKNTPTAATQSVQSPAAAPVSSAAAPASPVSPVPTAANLPVGTGPSVAFETPLYTGKIYLQGGDIQNLGLRKYPIAVDNPAPYPILDSSAARLTAQQSGFVAADGQVLHPQFSAPASVTPGAPITLSGQAGPLRVEKTFSFAPHNYVVTEDIRVTNTGTEPWQGSYFDQILRNDRTQSHWFMSIFTGAVLMHNGNLSEKSFSDLRDHPQQDVGPGWAGMTDHYFLQAVLPEPHAAVQLYARPEAGNYVAGVQQALPTLQPGQSFTLRQQLFLGPKQQELLASMGRGLEQTVDYGWFAIVAEPMHGVLKWFHSWTGNWGLAIILLVIAVKVIFFYPSAISYRSMANMRKLQPKLEQLKKECGDDRQKLGAKMMELYRTEKVNPMAGCLPIIIQMPVFIALYWVLVESVSLRQAPFILWIHDLAVPDPYYILPLLMGISMFLQQRLNPAPMDPVQKKIMSILPVAFGVFFSFFPAGLVLYWLTNNVVSIGQQYLITRHVMKEG